MRLLKRLRAEKDAGFASTGSLRVHEPLLSSLLFRHELLKRCVGVVSFPGSLSLLGDLFSPLAGEVDVVDTRSHLVTPLQ